MNTKTYFIIGILVLIIIALQPQEQKMTQLNRIQNPTVAAGQGGSGDFDAQKQALLISPAEPKKQANLPSDINRINGASASVEFGPLVNRRPLGDAGNAGTNTVTNTRILDLQEITSPGEETVAVVLTLSGKIVNTETLCMESTLFRPDGSTKKAAGQSCEGTPQSHDWEWFDWIKVGSVWTGKPYDILTTGQHKMKLDIVSGSPVSGSYEFFFDVTGVEFVCNQGEKACDIYQGSTWTTECKDNKWVRIQACPEACFLGACLLPDCSQLQSSASNSINSWKSNPSSSNKGNAVTSINRWATNC